MFSSYLKVRDVVVASCFFSGGFFLLFVLVFVFASVEGSRSVFGDAFSSCSFLSFEWLCMNFHVFIRRFLL